MEVFSSYIWCFCKGECCTCGKKIAEEDAGYTAMGKDYHISCFVCCHCGVALQGKPFYSLNGKPCCEEGYLVSINENFFL